MKQARCQVCGRRLRDPVSRARGTGPVCDRATRSPAGARTSDADQLTITEEP